ncbi:MAG: DUF2157 domain-containing protein [Kiritimatiellaeota bacterium]|nr:DUF2157 domain-containing protein [Kiritimatiellota bacterium]
MTNKKWLQQEMEAWQREGIIDAATRGRLEERYGADASAASWRQITLCSLGALLIGLGVIALLAANWDALSREVRTVFALLPLTLCVGAYALGLRKGWRSQGFLEPLGIFWGLSVGTGIALIAQTYHISGDAETFALSWTLLLLPTLYATRSVSVGVGYFAGLLAWATMVYDNSSDRMAYWLFACLAIPFIMRLRKDAPGGVRAGLAVWGAALCSTVALGVTLEKTLPGLWMVIYSGMFTSLLLGGMLCEPKHASIWQTPMRTLGGCGLTVLLYLLTFAWPWEEIGWEHRRVYNHSYFGVSLFDSALALLAPVLSVFLMVIAHRRKSDLYGLKTNSIPFHTFWGIAPLFVAIAYCIFSSVESGKELLPAYLTTLYLGCLGLVAIGKGIVNREVLFVNGGVLIVLGLILGKFFTSDLGFTAKGIAFIISGILFFVINTLASRQMKQAGGAQ